MHQVQGNNLNGIRGWLILVVIALVVSPIRIAMTLQNEVFPIFSDGTWEALTTASSAAYHHLWAPLIIFELLGNIISIALALVTLYFMFRRSRRTPAIAITWLSVGLIFVVADYFLAQLIPVVASQPADPESIKEVTRSIFGAAIWIPYFAISRRVKATFIE